MNNLFNFKLGEEASSDTSYLGTVLQVDTRRVVINAEDANLKLAGVGKLVALKGSSIADQWMIGLVDRIVRQITNDDNVSGEDIDEAESSLHTTTVGNAVTISLVGMVRWDTDQSTHQFTRSLTDMPDIGQDCYVLRQNTLKSFMSLLVKRSDTDRALEIGKYTMDLDATAYLDGDKFFQRHAAILGSTGSGKSWTVASILERASKLPSTNLIVFDLHGEYRKLSYADQLRVPGPDDIDSIDPNLLHLPYWLMNSEELMSMFVDNSEFTAHNQALIFQKTVVEEKKKRLEAESKFEILDSFTVDSPVPFDLLKVISHISDKNSEMVQGSRGLKKGDFNGQFSRLLARMETKRTDRRYGFLFQAPPEKHSYDAFHTLSEQLLSFDTPHKGIKVIDFSEVPADVLPVVLGIVGRLIYNLQFWMPDELRHPVAIACDEAHIYLPQEKGNPNQRWALESFEKIAKEGRKYGVSLLVISQRPSDVSSTILSQCNNVMALRLANNSDIATVKGMMPESMTSFLEILPLLDVGEALVVGDSVLLPSRIKINKPTEKPLSATIDFWSEWNKKEVSPNWKLAAENMRRQRRLQR